MTWIPWYFEDPMTLKTEPVAGTKVPQFCAFVGTTWDEVGYTGAKCWEVSPTRIIKTGDASNDSLKKLQGHPAMPL